MTTTRVDERLLKEVAEFSLRFGCEDCAHFAPETASCGNAYPTSPHLQIDLFKVSSLEFCKGFELT